MSPSPSFILLLLSTPAVFCSSENDADSNLRGRRQVHHFSFDDPFAPPRLNHEPPTQSPSLAGPYSVGPPHAPIAHLAPYSLFAAHPNAPTTPNIHSFNLAKLHPSVKPAHLAFHQVRKPSKPFTSKSHFTDSEVHQFPKPTSSPDFFRKPAITPAVTVKPVITFQPVPQDHFGVSKATNPFFTIPSHPPITPAPTHTFHQRPSTGSRLPAPNGKQPFGYGTHAPQTHKVPAFPPGLYAPTETECPGYDNCMPLVSCAAFYDYLILQPFSSCHLYGGASGVCCPPVKSTGRAKRIFRSIKMNIDVPRITLNDLNKAASVGLWELQERETFEQVLQERGVTLTNRNRPEYLHLQFFRTSPAAMYLARDALTNAFAGNQLVQVFKLSPLQAGFGLQKFSVKDTIISNTCPEQVLCGEKETFYRTIDGSCNNLRHSKWGQARTTFQRIVRPYYSDGIHSPRLGSNGRQLPSARIVSISNVVDADRPDRDFTLSVMQWGQFIDHDLTHSPIFRFGNESGIECCDERGQFTPSSVTHPSCLPIEIPSDDPFYSKFGKKCMNFIRSMPSPITACTFGYAEQMNQITHFLDGSNVYGSSADDEKELRLFKGGMLKMQEFNLLPVDRHIDEESCDANDSGFLCFLAGDSRVNEQPSLAVIHTVWMREHNRLAYELARLNPHWSDETIFQEARRIVIAQMQHIVYNEWLPIILGKKYVLENELLPHRYGFINEYSEDIDPTIFNEFATAAFRFGHTLVQGMIRLYDKGHTVSDSLPLRNHFNSPRLVYTPGKLDEFLRGLSKQPMQQFDNFVSEDLTNHLFQTHATPFGMDLIALNTQRGRDHAIAPYNALREACGLRRANAFEDFLDVIPAEVVARFKLLYASVDDVDPFIAGISERPDEGALLGPTFRCIVGDQFIRLKRGDRFFYENGGMETSFTEAQIYEIRKTSWARIICLNSEYIKEIQPLAMRRPGGLNKKVSCNSPSIPSIDLTPWISLPDK